MLRLFDLKRKKIHRPHGIHLYNTEISKELNRILKIEDAHDQDIAFDQLQQQHPRRYWVTRYRAYIYSQNGQQKKAIYNYEQFMSKFSKPFDKVTSFYDIGHRLSQ